MHDTASTTDTNNRSAHDAERSCADLTSHARKCLVRGESGPTDTLIRFAVAPDGAVVPDLAEKLPGRGMWVTADAECISTAIAKKMFGRAAGQPVTVPATLLADTTALLLDRVQKLLGLAKKASVLITGADAVREAAGKGKLSYIVIGADASAAGTADMAGRRATPTVRLPLSAAQLGAALGRDNTVYIGIQPGKQADALIRDIRRLDGLVNKDLL